MKIFIVFLLLSSFTFFNAERSDDDNSIQCRISDNNFQTFYRSENITNQKNARLCCACFAVTRNASDSSDDSSLPEALRDGFLETACEAITVNHGNTLMDWTQFFADTTISKASLESSCSGTSFDKTVDMGEVYSSTARCEDSKITFNTFLGNVELLWNDQLRKTVLVRRAASSAANLGATRDLVINENVNLVKKYCENPLLSINDFPIHVVRERLDFGDLPDYSCFNISSNQNSMDHKATGIVQIGFDQLKDEQCNSLFANFERMSHHPQIHLPNDEQLKHFFIIYIADNDADNDGNYGLNAFEASDILGNFDSYFSKHPTRFGLVDSYTCFYFENTPEASLRHAEVILEKMPIIENKANNGYESDECRLRFVRTQGNDSLRSEYTLTCETERCVLHSDSANIERDSFDLFHGLLSETKIRANQNSLSKSSSDDSEDEKYRIGIPIAATLCVLLFFSNIILLIIYRFYCKKKVVNNSEIRSEHVEMTSIPNDADNNDQSADNSQYTTLLPPSE